MINVNGFRLLEAQPKHFLVCIDAKTAIAKHMNKFTLYVNGHLFDFRYFDFEKWSFYFRKREMVLFFQTKKMLRFHTIGVMSRQSSGSININDHLSSQ